MPVVVIGADTPVGRDLIPLLRGRGSEVRATVRVSENADPIRSMGAKVTAAPVSDVDTLRAVLDEAHTVALLTADLFVPGGESYEGAIVEPAGTVLRVAEKAGVTRVLLVSYPGASSTSPNEFLRALGVAEDGVRASGLEHAIIRATHVYGRGSPWLEVMAAASTRSPAFLRGSGTQRLAPVFSMDLARALAAADDRAQPVSGTYGIQGPDVVTADELMGLLRKRARPSRPRGASGGSWSGAVEEILAADSLADAADANEEFGLVPTPLADGLTASGLGPRDGSGPARTGADPSRGSS
jgi:uncharacterized protein YbjT (DUF2867 family)